MSDTRGRALLIHGIVSCGECGASFSGDGGELVTLETLQELAIPGDEIVCANCGAALDLSTLLGWNKN